MARLFDDASSEYLKIDQTALAGYPFAAAGFFNSDDTAINRTLLWIGDKDETDQSHALVAGLSTYQKVRAMSYDGAFADARSTTSWSINTWHHACGIWAAATDRRAFIDGGSKGTNSTSISPAGFDRMMIGLWQGAGTSEYMSGKIAELGLWDLSQWPGATNADKADNFEKVIASLAKGFTPLHFPLGLVAYWPLIRDNDTDIVGGYNMTAYNTPSIAAHPKIILPRRPSVGGENLIVIEPSTLALSLAQQTPSLSISPIVEPSTLALASSLQTPTIISSCTVSPDSLALSVTVLAPEVGDIITITPDSFSLALAQQTPSLRFDYTVSPGSALALALAQQTPSLSFDYTVLLSSALSMEVTLHPSIVKTLYLNIPPFMHKDLIDPYSGGAWIWLCEIAMPGQATRRLARNTEDVTYDSNLFDKFNLQIGEQMFSGDGSIPRVTLRVFQDANRVIENMVNETEGALGANVKLIRVNEKFLNTPVSALEADYDSLASESDTEWVTFTLGIPNPLTQRFPLRIYSSSMCPWATPTLFKGPDCQYTGPDGTCTGTYEDCYLKGNAVNWGAELGLDPNVVRI